MEVVLRSGSRGIWLRHRPKMFFVTWKLLVCLLVPEAVELAGDGVLVHTVSDKDEI